MKAYIFSIFTRGFLALSGFTVFFVSAHLFGADGRGVIAYGTSLFASIGIILSLSLGRVFLGETIRDEALKSEFLSYFLSFNLLVSIISAGGAIIYWHFSPVAQHMLTLNELLCFSLLSLSYIWFHNGHPIYSAFSKTAMQDRVVVLTRLSVVGFLALIWLLDYKSLSVFIVGYSSILFIGAVAEMVVIKNIAKVKLKFGFDWNRWQGLIKSAFWPHLDYIAFNIMPLFIVIMSASLVSKTDLGRANFAMQMINVVFLFATTANMRVAHYVSNVGFTEKIEQIKKLLYFTVIASILAVLGMYVGLRGVRYLNILNSFQGVEELFLVAALSLPGFLSYQFLIPALIEIKKIKYSALWNLFSLSICLVILPWMVTEYQTYGVMLTFSLFYLLSLIGNFCLYKYFILVDKKTYPMIFVNASNINHGGGRVLLESFLSSVADATTVYIDSRCVFSNTMPANIEFIKVRPTVFARLRVEWELFRLVRHGQRVLFFGNLPPLFPSRGKVALFIQNTLLLDGTISAEFLTKLSIKQKIENHWLKFGIENVDKVIVQSEIVRSVFLKNFRHPNVKVVPFGDWPQLQSEVIEKKYDFVYVASGEPHKNHMRLFKAFELLQDSGHSVSLAVTISKNYKKLSNEIVRLQTKGILISNLGDLSRNEVMQVYRQSSALVFPSITESFGMPLIEAQTLGLDIIASEKDYVREFVSPIQSFDPESEVSIYRALRRYILKINSDEHQEIHESKDFLGLVFERDIWTS